MHNMKMKKKKKTSNNINTCDNSQVPKLKERHIVTWSQEEDDILREQIRIHGTDNWAVIASKFKDKTTRQCRRRWYTYLNSDFKKGGWSPEEDTLLCEAQKIFGNRWTEIAKVVSGRTDNAVKNRFSTLCKKKAKHEASAKENNTSYVNLNNESVMFENGLNTDGILETAVPLKKIRNHISDSTENCNHGEILRKCGTRNQQLRTPLAALVQKFQCVSDSPTQHCANNTMEVSNDAGSNDMVQGTYLKKDDPKIIALMQQAELLSSLALKVNTENTDQSLENTWKVLQDFLTKTKERDMLRFKISDMDFHLENFKDWMEDVRSSNDGSQPSWRHQESYEGSPESSEYSTGSTILLHTIDDRTEQTQPMLYSPHQDVEAELQSTRMGESNGLAEGNNGIVSGETTSSDILPSGDQVKTDDEAVYALRSTEFTSPLQVTPLFRSLAAEIPSPYFSESVSYCSLQLLITKAVALVGFGEAFSTENTWSGVPITESKHQTITASTLQKGPSSQSMIIH
ncbi:hypothetical protein LguiB_016122 [Lonicera macranthoides]